MLRIRRGAQYVPVTADRRGDLMTRVRFEDKIEDDIPPGWSLADGTTPAIPDLTENSAFFQGEAPNWTVYTVAFVGYGVQ